MVFLGVLNIFNVVITGVVTCDSVPWVRFLVVVILNPVIPGNCYPESYDGVGLEDIIKVQISGLETEKNESFTAL